MFDARAEGKVASHSKHTNGTDIMCVVDRLFRPYRSRVERLLVGPV